MSQFEKLCNDYRENKRIIDIHKVWFDDIEKNINPKLKLMTIVGTRPEIIKMSAIIKIACGVVKFQMAKL